MNNAKIISTLAMLKTRSDLGVDYIEIFVPFIVHLIKIKDYEEIDIQTIKDDFELEYGLIIPFYGIKTILKRCKTRGYILQHDYKFFPDKTRIISDDFSIESTEQNNKTEQLINNFSKYVKDNYQEKEISREESESLLLSFVRDHGSDIIYSSENSSVIPEIKVDKQNYYIVCKYIENLIEQDLPTFEYLLDLSIGQSLADIIICEDFNSYNYNLTKLNCYLDSGIIFYLLGTGGDKKQLVYQELIDSLHNCGAKLMVFEHTYEEISVILSSCIQWIDNPLFDPEKANRTLLFFVENGFHKSDAEMFSAKLDSVLSKNNIEVVERPAYEKDSIYQIDEKKLTDKIQEIYQERSRSGRNDLLNPETLDRDVKSIYSIYKLRRGLQPKTLKDAKYVFITPGHSFAYAVSKFEEENLEKFTIKSCLTDEFVSTIIWVHNPQKYKDINRKKIISDVFAALKPTKKLIKQFIYQINNLRKDGNLTEEQYFVLRGNKTSIDLLSEKTLSDPSNFSSKTIGEILIEEEKRARAEYYKEAQSHQMTKDQLADKEGKIDRVEIMLRKISKIISYIPAIIIVAILIIPVFSSNNFMVKLALSLGILFTIWGLGITVLRIKIENILFIKLKKIIE